MVVNEANQDGVMGTNDCSWKTLFFVGGLFLILFCNAFQAKAQVIIKEKMELGSSPELHEKSQDQDSDTNVLEVSRSLYRMEGYNYLVLRSGNLDLEFNSAYSYGEELSPADSIIVTIKEPNGQIRKQKTSILPFLVEPVTMQSERGGCTDTQYSYNDGISVLAFMGKDKNDLEIAEVGRVTTPSGNTLVYSRTMPDDIYFSHYYRGTEASEYDSVLVESKSYFEFDLTTFQTNGSFSGAGLSLRQREDM